MLFGFRGYTISGCKCLEGRAVSCRSDAADWATSASTERNNAQLVDDNTNQALTGLEIEAMRSVLTGEAVIAALEAASSTFASKTEFSQARSWSVA